MVQKGAVRLQYISTDVQVVDILTNPLPQMKFTYYKDRLGVVENASLCEREH